MRRGIIPNRLFVVLVILAVVVGLYTFSKRSSHSTIDREITTPIPTSTEPKLNNLINYTAPQGWMEQWRPASPNNVQYIHLTSPDYQRNSVNGPDKGASVDIERMRVRTNKPLKQLLLEDYKATESATLYIDNLEAFVWHSSIEYSPNIVRYSVIKDGYIWLFTINYLDAKAKANHIKEITGFINSIVFK